MKLTTAARVVLGILFICSGGVKVPRIGKALSPDTHSHMVNEFKKFLRVSPFKDFMKIKSSQYMQAVGYTELFCGFFLLSAQLVSLASSILCVIMLGGAYTHYKLKDPAQVAAFPLILFLILLFIRLTHGRKKEKQE